MVPVDAEKTGECGPENEMNLYSGSGEFGELVNVQYCVNFDLAQN